MSIKTYLFFDGSGLQRSNREVVESLPDNGWRSDRIKPIKLPFRYKTAPQWKASRRALTTEVAGQSGADLSTPSIIPLTEVGASLASLTARIPAKDGRAVPRGNPRRRRGGVAVGDNMEEATTTEGTFCLQRILGFFLRPPWRGRGWWGVSVGLEKTRLPKSRSLPWQI